MTVKDGAGNVPRSCSQISQRDYRLPKVYLDRQAMAAHQFIDGENTTINIPYNLVFSVVTRDIIPLPAPACLILLSGANTGSCQKTSLPTGTTRQRLRRSLGSGTLRCPLHITSTWDRRATTSGDHRGRPKA